MGDRTSAVTSVPHCRRRTISWLYRHQRKTKWICRRTARHHRQANIDRNEERRNIPGNSTGPVWEKDLS